ncbi:MAG TPA: choice-of-anchor Q domain-containing protein [Rudaea sp.]|nr:choice-of-anchor Q domain-containing protein [Rudaea sp.]
MRASSADLPGDTIIGKAPLPGPLRNNGGVTLTHRLLSHSPAMDAGNGTHGSDFDRRFPPSARVSASSADRGACEVAQADTIFDANSDGCSSRPIIG